MNTALIPAPEAFDVSIRREHRISTALLVKATPVDNLFGGENVCTYDISRVGARVTKPRRTLDVGDMLWISRKGNKARYRIVWVGDDGTDRHQQLGVECVDSHTCIWDEELRRHL